MNLNREPDKKQVQPSKAAYVFGGLSFIPSLGILFGIIAIVLGIIKKTKGPIILGSCGIMFSVLLYGGLFYFGFVAKFGPYYEMKKQIAVTTLTQTRGQILIYKEKNKKLPDRLEDMGKPSQDNLYMTTDLWNNPIIYKPNPDGTFELRSAGPDGVAYTKDDIVSK